MRHSIFFSNGEMLVSFIGSSLDFRQFQFFLLSKSLTVLSSSKSLELTNSFFL